MHKFILGERPKAPDVRGLRPSTALYHIRKWSYEIAKYDFNVGFFYVAVVSTVALLIWGLSYVL